MTVLEIAQGHYPDLTGMLWDDAIRMFQRDDAQFRAKYPASAYPYQPWHERQVIESATAPWGYEWYIENAAGKLARHSAHYDSSG